MSRLASFGLASFDGLDTLDHRMCPATIGEVRKEVDRRVEDHRREVLFRGDVVVLRDITHKDILRHHHESALPTATNGPLLLPSARAAQIAGSAPSS